MTRKRFIKSVMGMGHDRNTASRYATLRPAKKSYDKHFRDCYMSFALGIYGISAKKATKSLRKFGLAVASAFTSYGGGGVL